MPVSTKRFGRNYNPALLNLQVDRRGFLVGRSRLGYSKLGPGGALISILGGFTSISLSLACTVKDGAFLEPQVTRMTLRSPNPALFSTYDGEAVLLTYNGQTLLDGFIETSTLAFSYDLEARKEVSEVSVTCSDFSTSTYQSPPSLGATTVYGTPENPGNTIVPGRNAESVLIRGRAITNEAMTVEDNLAAARVEDRLGAITAADQATSNQGAMLLEMAHRAGVLVDLTTVTPTWRAYEAVPTWRLTENDVAASGTASLDTDRESPGALLYYRDQDNNNRIAFSASGTNLIEREISTEDTTSYGLTAAASYTPLRKRRDVYLASVSVPFSPTVPLVSRLPLKVALQRAATTYRGAVVALRHTITPQRWLVSADLAPVHLVTRVSDVTPATVQHVRASAGAGTFTASWTGTANVCTATAAGTSTTLVTSDAAALDVALGDQVRVVRSTGVNRDERIVTVTGKTSASGTTTITLDTALASATAVGDFLRLVDFGVPVQLWHAVYRIAGGAGQAIPYDAGAVTVQLTSPTITVTGLAAGVYTVTIFAKTSDGFRSPPSARTVLTVT